jgi:hypothetical protein
MTMGHGSGSADPEQMTFAHHRIRHGITRRTGPKSDQRPRPFGDVRPGTWRVAGVRIHGVGLPPDTTDGWAVKEPPLPFPERAAPGVARPPDRWIPPRRPRRTVASRHPLRRAGAGSPLFPLTTEGGVILGFDKRIAVVVSALVGVLLVATVVVATVGFTTRPFDTSGERATSMAQNSLGDRYTLDAASISATWTFTRDAEIVLRFADGDVTLDQAPLDPGCYSGTISNGAVLTINDAHGVSFATPSSDTSCLSLPARRAGLHGLARHRGDAALRLVAAFPITHDPYGGSR